ncbi:MAG: TIGR03862 family flavoprotein [Alphaproteobacteria bacterium]|nr:TIGR03862 family flavoprotein [Alphaproteobacteria bacterium]MDX5414975.1 TIGR03862 family flavoprotein [Alphaproteobacteria bacterium]MDX5492158.1 TIGR03862 family flavoprotein [Alphaproteobacteria bacterium]
MNIASEKSAARPIAAIIGGGPAGLAAAERLCTVAQVHVFDAMPSLGRKFLLAGKSGLNITHAEEFKKFLTRFGEAHERLAPALRGFTPEAIRRWAADLGIETFEGSSGRIFPRAMKASPLLRAWLANLRERGVAFHPRYKWQGWTETGGLRFAAPDGERIFEAAATILALGGASWPRLGSDGGWTGLLAARGIEVAPLRPANCGFDANWSALMKERFAGAPVKSVVLTHDGKSVKGDFVVTESGVEGSAIYALSASLRDAIERDGEARLVLDLAPDRSEERLAHDLAGPRGKASLANHLRRKAGIDGVKAALLREGAPADAFAGPAALAHAIKHLQLRLLRPRPIAEAISSAGGIALNEVDDDFMLKKLPGTFAAGEMLDWEAPTGGYLLTACLATGRAAGDGAARFLTRS